MISVSDEMSYYTNIVILKGSWHFLPNFKAIFQLKNVKKNVTGRKYIKFTIDHKHLTILHRAYLEKPYND
jgi:hypothetical protein